MTRLYFALAIAALVSPPLVAQSPADNHYVFLGDERSYDRAPSGVTIHAANGAVSIEAIAGVGIRVRTRFGDGNAGFPTIHSLATGDSVPKLGAATVSEDGDAIVVSGEGVVARVRSEERRVGKEGRSRWSP